MTAGLPAVLGGVAALCIACGGLALIIQARSFARALFLAGVGLAIAAGFSPSIQRAATALTPIELLTATSAAAGVLSLALGRPRIGMALLWPVVSRWMIWPLLKPYVLANWVLIVLVLAPFSIFILIWLLQRILTPIYGERAAGHVTGEYLVRSIDATGRILGWLIALPFRLIFRPTGPR